ncbi:MAG: hypothetical protein AAF229_01900 [Pseudomonadota bacterium]
MKYLIPIVAVCTAIVSLPASAQDACTKPNDATLTVEQSLDAWGAYADCQAAVAENADDTTAAIKANQEANEAKEKADERAQDKAFFGTGWGVGVGAGFGRGPDRINGAEIVNGVVRVTDDVTDSPRLFLEIHYFFGKGKAGRKWGHGPFATVNFGANGSDTLTSFGAGYMVGFKRPESSSSLNFGLGVSLDSNVMQLGDGISANQPLPDGESEIRFTKSSEPSIILLVSTKF